MYNGPVFAHPTDFVAESGTEPWLETNKTTNTHSTLLQQACLQLFSEVAVTFNCSVGPGDVPLMAAPKGQP